MKPLNLDTAKIMHNFDRPRQTVEKTREELEEFENQSDDFYHLVDEEELQKRKIEKALQDEEKERINRNPYGYVEKRVAKENHEIRKDILMLYNHKDVWTWDEVKHRMSDQPEQPLKKCLLELCEKVPGSASGGAAEYALRSTYKIR